jgi:hypothetical protein
MKKLSLEMLRLTSDEVLQRSQMKKITGGYGSGSCGYKHTDGLIICGLTMTQAQQLHMYGGGNWCCNSCGTYC